MHLDPGTVERLLDGELGGPEEARAREHLAACAECRQQVDATRQERDETHALLRHLDHPVPRSSAGTVVARVAAPPEPSLVLRAAGILVAVGIAVGAAYAIPGSPLRGWVKAALESIGERRVAPTGSPAAADTAYAGISVAPGAELSIQFLARQSEGHARVTLTDGADVVIRAPRGAAVFTSDSDRLVIDNRGATAVFEVQVPRTAPRIEIQIEGERVFHKGRTLVFPGEATGGGEEGYVLPLGPAAPR